MNKLNQSLSYVSLLIAILIVASCSSPTPHCGSAGTMHKMPTALKSLGLPFDESSALCECINDKEEKFYLTLSHADNGTIVDVYNKYKAAFVKNGFEEATEKETDELIIDPSSKSSNITMYFFKDDVMLMCKVREDIVHDGLQDVILQDYSHKFVSKSFDVNEARTTLKDRFEMLAKSLKNANNESIPKMNKEMLNGRKVLFQFYDNNPEKFDKYERDEMVQLTKKHKNTDIIALVQDTKVPHTEFDAERDGYKEVWSEEEGRTITYFKGGNKSGTVYFMDKNTGSIIGKRFLSAGNSYQTSDPGKDLLDNYYGEIRELEDEFDANDRSMK